MSSLNSVYISNLAEAIRQQISLVDFATLNEKHRRLGESLNHQMFAPILADSAINSLQTNVNIVASIISSMQFDLDLLTPHLKGANDLQESKNLKIDSKIRPDKTDSDGTSLNSQKEKD